MPDEQNMAGGSIDAIGQRQAALSTQHTASADADRALADTLAKAYAATVESVSRLDAIAAEIDGAVRNQGSLALDTAIGAREFQKFLSAKQQEIVEVVSHARDVNDATRAALETLRENYTSTAG